MRENRINIRLNDDEYAVIPKNAETHRVNVDFCREALTNYASLKQTCEHYHKEIEKLEKENNFLVTDNENLAEASRQAHVSKDNAIEAKLIMKGRIEELEKEILVLQNLVDGFESLKESVDRFKQTMSQWKDADDGLLKQMTSERDELMKENVVLQKDIEVLEEQRNASITKISECEVEIASLKKKPKGLIGLFRGNKGE